MGVELVTVRTSKRLVQVSMVVELVLWISASIRTATSPLQGALGTSEDFGAAAGHGITQIGLGVEVVIVGAFVLATMGLFVRLDFGLVATGVVQALQALIQGVLLLIVVLVQAPIGWVAGLAVLSALSLALSALAIGTFVVRRRTNRRGSSAGVSV